MWTKIDSHPSSYNHEFKDPNPVEQVKQINSKSQKRKHPDITADKPFMESGACPPFIKPAKQDEEQGTHPDSIFKTVYLSCTSNCIIYDSNKKQIYHSRI